MKKMQRAQNNAARVVLAVNRRSDAKPLLRQLHCMVASASTRAVYKMALLTRKTRTTGVPAYLNEHLVAHFAVHHTRSAWFSSTRGFCRRGVLSVPHQLMPLSRHLSDCKPFLVTIHDSPTAAL